MDVLTREKGSFKMSHKLEIEVREFLFTDDEIEEDWERYQKIVDVKKVLMPAVILGGEKTLSSLKLDEIDNDEDVKKENAESLSKIVRYKNHFGEDLKMA